MKQSTKISVGIVTYNSSADIAKCLSTLIKYTPKKYELDIYVFDNQSPDSHKTHRIIKKDFPTITLITSNDNKGFGFGHNQIISRINSDLHLILNADIEFEEDTLSVLSNYLLKYKDAVLVTPEIRNTDNSIQHLPKKYPKFKYILSSTISTFSKYRTPYTRSNENLLNPTLIEISTGCFMLCRTAELKKTGGFDDNFFLYFEDFDLSLRLRKYGKLIYHPGTHVKHFWHRDSKKSRKLFFIQIKSMLRFYRKWAIKRLARHV